MNTADESPVRRSKSRDVASRFLSTTAHDSPNKASSPLRRKSTSTDTRKQHQQDPSGGLIGGLWPSSTAPSSSNTKKLDTLADYLGNERLKDFIERKSYGKIRTNDQGPFSLTKQTSHTEFSRFIENNDEEIIGGAKENHLPASMGLGGSMRCTTKLGFSRKSTSSSSTSSYFSSNIIPGRHSVDENALYKKPSFSPRKKPDSETDKGGVTMKATVDGSSVQGLLKSEIGEHDSPATSKIKTNSSPSSRKSGIEVSSKYLKELRSRGASSDSNNHLNPASADNSPKMSKKLGLNMIRRTNSHGASSSRWALSPGRSKSPSMSVENMIQPTSFSSLKPPVSPSRTRGVEKFLNLGLMDLFKSKKSSDFQVGSGDVESVHRLRLIHNCLIQWRYANAKADVTNGNINNQVENYMLSVWNSLMKLQHSVVRKKSKLQKEKLEMKINFILQSQMKVLESWADMERRHSTAISMTKQCLHSVVCKVPLVEGSKVYVQSASMALRRAFDFAASIKSMISASSPGIEKAASLVSELAEVVAEEKRLLEECLELTRIISVLEIEERSLMCNIIELDSQQRRIQQVA